MSGEVSPSPLWGGWIGAKRRDGWGNSGVSDVAADRQDPHPSRFAAHPPHEGEGEGIVAVARAWIGTPYRHQASAKGAGCDCLGLVRGVWREMIGPEPEIAPPYAPDWAEVGGRETLLEAARRHLVEVAASGMAPGDVLLFRMAAGAPVKHCAILTSLGPPQPRIVHAYWGRAVVESWLGPWWFNRLSHAFRFPSPLAGEGVGAADG